MGDIALDNKSYNDVACPISNTCDFESVDFCGYKNDLNGAIRWEIVQGTNNEFDHSYGTDIGHNMNAKTTSPHIPNRMGRLLSLIYPPTIMCLSFWSFKTQGDVLFNIRLFFW